MMSDSKLAKEMLDLFRLKMKSINPQATPTEFQEYLTSAISKALVEILSSTGVFSIVPSPVAVGQNGIGLIVQPDIMEKAALAKILVQTKGNKGPALDLILNTVMVTTAKHLAEAVEVVPQNGFGGQALPPQVEDSVISSNIISKLPAKFQQSINQSKHGADLIKAIAFGFAAGLKTSVPGFVPVGSTPPPPGLMQAVFK